MRTALISIMFLAVSLSAKAQVLGLTKDQVKLISGSWVKLESTPKDLQSVALWTFVDSECAIKMIDGKMGMFGREAYSSDSYEHLKAVAPNIEEITGHMHFASKDDLLVVIEHGVLNLSRHDMRKVKLSPVDPTWVRAKFIPGRVITENGADRLEFPFPPALDWMIAPLQRPGGKQTLLAKSNDTNPDKSGYFMQCTK